MKKKVKVIGIGHITGKNAKGEYDFYQLHATFKDDRVEGDAVICATISDGDVYDICIGEECTIFTHFYNGREVVDAVLR